MDRYAELLRGALAPRLAELGLEPLPPAGSLWGARGRFAIALTHDLDNLWRWTRRGFAASGYRTLRAARHLRRPRRRPRAGRRRRLAGAPLLAPHRPLLDVPADPARRGRARRLLDLLRDRPPHAQAGRQPAGDLPAQASPRPSRLVDRRRPRGRPARQRRRPAGARRADARPRRPRRARRPRRRPASATTTCGRSTTRRCRCSSRPGSPTTPPWRSPSTRASAAAARSRSGRTPWRRSGPSTSSSCRSP